MVKGWYTPWVTDDSAWPEHKLFWTIVFFLFLRYYSASKPRMYYAKRRLDGKTAIITGANSGIGKETAKYLAKLGARVILACRNIDEAEKAKTEIIEDTKNSKILVQKLDLSSFQSIREFATEINNSEERLDILINNAGYANTFKKAVSIDGIEMTMATNHYGPFLLTHLLIDLLKKTEGSRIVVIASSFYRLASLNLNNFNPKGTLPVYLYYASKNANIMFSQELAKRLKCSGVAVHCLHPGVVDTGIWKSAPFPLNLPLLMFRKWFFKTPEQGCQTTVFCAVSEELNGVTGRYYDDNREARLVDRLKDEKRNIILWDTSIKMVQLTENDPKI